MHNFLYILSFLLNCQIKFKTLQFLSTYLYGAACHKIGQSYATVLSYANIKVMNMSLQVLSKK